MKPISLTMQGINSYRNEQTIDFSELTAYGLFGIFGPTGSGKSSILDAITLALYARLPRSTKNYININEKKASVSFTFSITTDTTQTYQVDRSFRYQGKEGTKTVHNVSARLLKLCDKATGSVSDDSPVVIADRPTEVTQECISLLGLGSDDFMRTVVLPQGQFSEFLKLKNRERRGMLQRIFHLEQYGEELNRKISAARMKQELTISNLEGELKSYIDVSLEQITKTDQQLSDAKNSYEKGVLQERELSELFQEKNTIRDLLNEYEPLQEQYKKQLARREKMLEDKKTIEIARKANQLKPLINQSEKAVKDHQNASLRLSELTKKLSDQQEAFDQLRIRRELFLADYSSVFPSLLEQSQKLQTALQLSRSIKDYQLKKTEVQESIERNQTLQKELETQKNQLNLQEEDLKKNIQALDQEAGLYIINPDHKAALEKGHLLEEQYRERRLHFEKKKKAIDREAGLIREAKEKLKETASQACTVIYQVQNRLLALKNQQTDIEKASEELTFKKQENDLLLSEYRKGHMAAILRSSLKEGEICPVCGQIHGGDISAEFTEGVGPGTGTGAEQGTGMEQIKACEKTEKLLQKEALDLQSENTRLTQTIVSLENELSSLEEIVSNVSETTDFQASDPSAKPAEASKATSGSSSKVPVLSDNPLQASSPRELMLLARKIRESFSSSQGSLHSLAAGHQHSTKELKEEHAILSQTLNDIYGLRQNLGIKNCSEELGHCRQMEQKNQELQKQIRKIQKALEGLSSEKETLQASIAQASMQTEVALKQHTSYESFISEQQQQFPEGVSLDADHETLHRSCREKIIALEEQKSHLEKDYQQMEKENQFLREKVSSAQSQEQQSARHAKEAAELVMLQKSALGFDETFTPEDWYLSETEIQTKALEIDNYQKALKQYEERMRYLEEKLSRRTCTLEEWQTAKDSLEKVMAHNKELQQQITVLEHQKQTFSDRLTVKEELEKSLQSANHRHDLITQLAKLFKGNTFIEYMAESRLRYIAREASQILSDISGGDYTLEVNDTSEFVIRDNKNGGVLRPCDTLSGGETFITSLSLALSLSSAIQLNGTAPLELFFLDEGFGSLDSDLLEVVMTSLEHLKNRKRSIGIITHVEAIRSRVPVKLTVIPSEEGESGSQIVMEYT